MVRPPNAIDFWRGFALVTIFVNHIPGIWYERLTHRNVSISDSAELFVFLAGWSLRNIVSGRDGPTPMFDVLARVGGRTLTIYGAHLMITSLGIAMLAAAAIAWSNPLLLEWHNAGAIFYDPVPTHIGLVLLSHQVGYFDILPLYVVLMLLACGWVVIDRWSTWALVVVSFAIYMTAICAPITVPKWPEQGQWFFNPLAWQFIFVLGFVMAKSNEGLGKLVREHMTILRWIALPIVLFSAYVVYTNWWFDPMIVPEPRLLFLNAKTFQSPMRLLQFLALAAVMSVTFPYIERWLGAVVRLLSMLGRNSLHVFCMGSLLSLAGQIVRFVAKGNFAVDTAMVVLGVVVMAITAWLAEHPQRVRHIR